MSPHALIPGANLSVLCTKLSLRARSACTYSFLELSSSGTTDPWYMQVTDLGVSFPKVPKSTETSDPF